VAFGTLVFSFLVCSIHQVYIVMVGEGVTRGNGDTYEISVS